MNKRNRTEIEVVNNIDSDDNDDDDSWDEMEEDGQAEPTKCLFCDTIESSIEKAIEHLDQQHQLNLNAVKLKFNLDQYSYIKVRSMEPKFFQQHF